MTDSNETQRLPTADAADGDRTAGWTGEPVTPEAAFVPGSRCLSDFARDHARLPRDEFLARITEPHLVVSGRPSGEAPAIMTQVADPAQLRRELESVRIIPLRKREGSNSFSMMITVGRTENNDVVIKHSMLSKFHVYFRQAGTWTLTDGSSSNGTVVNGEELVPGRSVPLASGAKIVLGSSVSVEFIEPSELYDALLYL